MKRICFFGIYDPEYARNRVLRLGFERSGWQVADCRVDPREYRGISKYIALSKLGLKARREQYDIVLVCFPGQSIVPLARLIFGKRILFDAFLSQYDSNVFDRKIYGAKSVRGRRDFFLDRLSCRLARRVLLDTNAHIDYFVKTFGIPKEKFIRAWISADDTVFMPRAHAKAETFTVQFHGTFIPLQGVPYVIEAAEHLKDIPIQFVMYGSGQTYSEVENLVKAKDLRSVEFRGKAPVTEIAEGMESADVVLGIFGTTEKALRVIPNKVYEGMAAGKAIVTADTPAIRELPGASEALILVPVGNNAAIARAIRTLYELPQKKDAMGARAKEVFDKECSPLRVVAHVISELEAKTSV